MKSSLFFFLSSLSQILAEESLLKKFHPMNPVNHSNLRLSRGGIGWTNKMFIDDSWFMPPYHIMSSLGFSLWKNKSHSIIVSLWINVDRWFHWFWCILYRSRFRRKNIRRTKFWGPARISAVLSTENNFVGLLIISRFGGQNSSWTIFWVDNQMFENFVQQGIYGYTIWHRNESFVVLVVTTMLDLVTVSMLIFVINDRDCTNELAQLMFLCSEFWVLVLFFVCSKFLKF